MYVFATTKIWHQKSKNGAKIGKSKKNRYKLSLVLQLLVCCKVLVALIILFMEEFEINWKLYKKYLFL